MNESMQNSLLSLIAVAKAYLDGCVRRGEIVNEHADLKEVQDAVQWVLEHMDSLTLKTTVTPGNTKNVH